MVSSVKFAAAMLHSLVACGVQHVLAAQVLNVLDSVAELLL